MPIITRTTRVWYPGALTEAAEISAEDCNDYATTQALAARIQEEGPPAGSASISAGKIYTSLTVAELADLCGTVP